MTNAIVKGSIADVAQQSGKSIAESFVNADAVVIVDTSASMSARDASQGRSRYDAACAELAKLQATMPGKIAVLSFSNQVVFCPDGTPVNLSSGTDLAGALRFVKMADVPGAMQFVIISDGEPDDPSAALAIAKKFQNKIDVIYIGPEEMPTGRTFLAQLAKAAGGQTVTAASASDLSKQAQYLLSA